MKSSGLTKSTAWYTLGNLFVRSSNFLLLPLYSNFIPPEEFGNYALLMSFYSIAMVLYQGGYKTALNKFFLKETDSLKQLIVFATISRIALMIGFLLSILIILFSSDISQLIFNSEYFSGLIILIAGAMFFETSGSQLINYLITIQKASKVVLILAAGAVINFSLNIYLIYYLKLGITGIIIAQLISAAVMIIILSPMLLRILRQRMDPAITKNLFVFTYPLIIGGLLSIGVDVADRFILNHYLGKADVGIYSFSYRIALIMNLFVISFRTAWTPYSIDLYYKGTYTEQFGGTLLKYISAAGFIFILTALVTGDLFSIRLGSYNVFEDVYKEGIHIIPFILGGYFLNGISSFYSVYPLVSNRTYHFIVSDGLAFIINIILNIILIPFYGLAGAAASTLFAFTVGAGYLMILSGRHIRIRYPVNQILIVLVMVILITIVGYLINNVVVDIMFAGLYLIILMTGLKLRPGGLFADKRIDKVN